MEKRLLLTPCRFLFVYDCFVSVSSVSSVSSASLLFASSFPSVFAVPVLASAVTPPLDTAAKGVGSQKNRACKVMKVESG